MLPAPHNVLRIHKLWGAHVLWSFEIILQPDCMGVWVMGCHERRECMQRLARGMCSEDGSVYFNSSASFSGIWSEDLWFPYSLCSLYYSLDFGVQFSLLLFWLSWTIPVLFLRVSNVCILGFLDFSLRRGKFFPSICLSSLFNLSKSLKFCYNRCHIFTLILGLKKEKLFLTHHVPKAGLLQVIFSKWILTDS